MSQPLIIAVPSKGRLKEQVDAWLADCGLNLRSLGGARGYSAALQGFDEVQVRLLSASDIAAALLAGDIHMGVTGEDLLREAGDDTSREDEGGDGSTFAVDRADLLFNAEQMMATVDEINEALWRMDRGTWGMCTSCGDPIMKARLEYWPEASMCVECKQGGLVRR